MSNISVSAQREILALNKECEQITSKPLTAESRKRFDYNLAKISLLRSGQLSDEVRNAQADELAAEFGFDRVDRSEEARTKRAGIESFRAYVAHGEFRTYAGMNTVTGANGGYLLPVEFERTLLQGMAQYDDLLNPANVRVIPTQKGRSLSLPSIDLSTISAAIVTQNTQQLPVANPTVATNALGGYTYKTNPIAVTMELEQDSFESTMQILSTAFGIGIARGAGADLVNGNGTTAPNGLLNVAANSGVTSASAAFSADELREIYMSVNRAYRSSPKAAWVLNDATYQSVLALKDTNGRPLIHLTDDGERLYGKKVLIAPSMPTAAGSKAIVFGDLSQFAVRVVGSPEVKRASEVPGYVEKGIALYTGWLRVDSGLIAPGSVAPIVYATLHS
jgi:HK97 family phage major capsid protein